MKICYQAKDFHPKTLDLIRTANKIIAEYQQQGYDLTLRQLYYQLVARDIIDNKQSEYKRLGSIISDARRAGLIDWNTIVDRTRGMECISVWDTPQDILAAVAKQYRSDFWENQPLHVEIAFEKDALMGVFERVANNWRIGYTSCRGYISDSEIWSAAQRLKSYRKDVYLLYFGDHDPSGIHMTEDVRNRLALFGADNVIVERLALNMDQIQQYNPPPNPAKETDTRFAAYQDEFGDESWELDALSPPVLDGLVRDWIRKHIDTHAWEESYNQEQADKQNLEEISRRYEDVIEFLERDD